MISLTVFRAVASSVRSLLSSARCVPSTVTAKPPTHRSSTASAQSSRLHSGRSGEKADAVWFDNQKREALRAELLKRGGTHSYTASSPAPRSLVVHPILLEPPSSPAVAPPASPLSRIAEESNPAAPDVDGTVLMIDNPMSSGRPEVQRRQSRSEDTAPPQHSTVTTVRKTSHPALLTQYKRSMPRRGSVTLSSPSPPHVAEA